MGGVTAQQLALDAPQRVKKLVLVSSFAALLRFRIFSAFSANSALKIKV